MKIVLHFRDVTASQSIIPLRVQDLKIWNRECCVLFDVETRLRQTLLRLATGASLSDEGIISILGMDTTKCDEDAWFELMEKIAIFDPGSPLKEGGSIGENLALTFLTQDPPAREPELSRNILRLSKLLRLTIAQLAANVHDSATVLRLKTRLGRALSRCPQILFVDTRGLDSESRQLLPALLKRVHRKLKVTIVVFTSDAALTEQIADRVIFLQPQTGKFVENKMREWYHKLLRFRQPTLARRLRLAADIAEYSRSGRSIQGPGKH